MVDNEWWMQESDPSIRALLKQFASGELSAAEMNVIAQQLNQPQTQTWHGYVPRPGYARFTAPYLLQSPGAPVNVEGAWQDPTLATQFTPEQQRAFDALVRKYPTAQPPDPGD